MSEVVKVTKNLWISPTGEVIEIKTGERHIYYAKRYYDEKGINLPPMQAMERFCNEGWIMIQVSNHSVSVEGTELFISNIDEGLVLKFLNLDFKTLVFSFIDTGAYKRIPKLLIEGWSWSSIVKEAKNGLISFGCE